MRSLSLSLLLLVCGCADLFQKPQISVKRVDITSLSFAGLGINVVFNVSNPNFIGADVARLDYNLTVNNHAFAAGGVDRALHVPANGAGELILPVSFKFLELGQALVSIFTRKTVPFTIATRLGFGTPLGIITVPINHSGTLPVPQLPSLSLANAGVGAMSARGANVSVTLHVLNNNAFTLPLGPLNYSLSIEGAPIVSASTQPISLAPSASMPLTISSELDFFKVGMGIYRAIERREATLALAGNFDLKGYSMPVNLATTLR